MTSVQFGPLAAQLMNGSGLPGLCLAVVVSGTAAASFVVAGLLRQWYTRLLGRFLGLGF